MKRPLSSILRGHGVKEHENDLSEFEIVYLIDMEVQVHEYIKS